MTSIYSGVDTNFYSIADIHEDLNIAGAGNQEFEFLSGSKGDQMYTWNQYMNYILFNKEPERVKDQVKSVTNALNIQQKTENINNVDRTVQLSINDALAKLPQLSKFKKFTDYIGYGKLKDFSSKITLFAPVNDHYDEHMWYLYNVSWTSSTAIDTLRYHILPYLLLPWQLRDRKLRLRTDLQNRTVDTDWTNGRTQLINPLSYNEQPGDWFPTKDWEVNILGMVECDNGIIYIIDRPLKYPQGATGGN